MGTTYDTLWDAQTKLGEVQKAVGKAQSELRQNVTEAKVAASVAQKLLSKIKDDEVRTMIESQVTKIIEALGHVG